MPVWADYSVTEALYDQIKKYAFHWKIKLSEGGISMYGVITKYFNDRGYGFIQSMTNGETYFIHKKDLNGEYVRTGSLVYFSHYKSKNRKK